MKKILLLLGIILTISSGAQVCSELFISEYVEGPGNNNAIDRTKILRSLSIILVKLSVWINPPEDIVVKDKLTESRSLIFTKLNKKIKKRVDKKYIIKILIKL